MKRPARTTRKSKPEECNVKKEKFIRGNTFPALTPTNENQAILLEAFKYSTIVVASGSAGTGKTFLSCWHAAKKLDFKDIKKIVLIRAYQPLAGRSIGFLPGELEDKLRPYYQQMLDYFEDFIGKNNVEIHLKNKTIEICSLETIRGRSWENTIIIVDEAQSLVIPEIQALVTRVGENSQIIFCGDDSGVQTDVKNGMDGLTYLKKIVEKYNISDSAFIKFTRDDIVRSGLTKEFVIAFEEELVTNDPIVPLDSINLQFRKQR
jgi:phosphate starvation-inducible PhoH-like protein